MRKDIKIKTIIAGSRSITNYILVCQTIDDSAFDITVVVSGKAKGVDLLGEAWAKKNKIPIDPYPITSEDWAVYGKKAGHVRNMKMAENADALIAIWDGTSPGTKDMISIAKNKGLFTYVYTTRT